ncbi:MAG: helix-turn-helix transcriptional regulator [Bacteroidia bacterium]|jgi:AraC-like DNA-binding protein|nr:helix-turn-helix transcriptional regulator [Bacteroidia bacterium]
MVCNRCKMVVESELKKFGLNPISIDLGEVEITEELSKVEVRDLSQSLSSVGFSIIDNKHSKIIEKIKSSIIKLIYSENMNGRINLSSFITGIIHHDYNYLSNLFSQVEGTTIEQYFILQKIERVKELIMYNEMTLSEIAIILNYSSVSHLSSQFKKVTGFTPSYFKELKAQKRQSIDNL